MIPTRLTLESMQFALLDIYSKINPLLVGNIDMSQRRVINAGKAVGDFDYVTKLDLSNAVGQLPKTAISTSSTSTILSTVTATRVGAFATRGAAAAHSQELFFASDHNYVAWVSTGSAWIYQSGENYAAQSGIAAIASVLGTNDANYILNVTDFTHRIRWTGSAWNFAHGDDGSYYFVDAPGTPTGGTWGLCDGSAYTYLKADGTTGSYTSKNLTGHFRKSVTSGADATVAAAAPGFSGTSGSESSHSHNIDPPATNSGNPSATTTVDNVGSGSTVAVGSNTHTHSTNIAAFSSDAGSAHSHGAGSYAVDSTGEPAAYKALTYFRR